MMPTSPDLKKPSGVMTLAVSSGRCQYPAMTCGPRIAISPGWPSGTGFSASSRIAMSVFGNRQPDRPGVFAIHDRIAGCDRRGFRKPIPFDDRHARDREPLFGHCALHGHAAAVRDAQAREIELAELGIFGERVVERVDARDHVELVLRKLAHEAGDVAWIRDQHVQRAERGCRTGNSRPARKRGTAAARRCRRTAPAPGHAWCRPAQASSRLPAAARSLRCSGASAWRLWTHRSCRPCIAGTRRHRARPLPAAGPCARRRRAPR